MATNSAAKTEPQHPPLARDAQGNLVAIPDGTAAWRICRQTTGRPKEIAGPNEQMLRFPLETTAEQLADMCGADVYRVYALDEVGKVLDYVVTVDLTRDAGELRNAAPDLALVPAARTTPVTPSSDLRFALEAMAQMMRTNSDALRAVTETQADCVKALVSVRGFFRNAPPPQPPPDEADDEDESEDDDQPPPNKTMYDVLAPLAEHWAPATAPLISMLAGSAGIKAPASAPDASAKPASFDAALASKPNWEVRDLVDLNYASAKAKAKKAAKQAAEAGATNGANASLQARVMADPKLLAQFLAIKSRLNADETTQLLALGERMSSEEQEFLIAQISGASPEGAAALLRGMLAEFAKANMTTETTK